MPHESIVNSHRVSGEELAINWLRSLRSEEADVFFDRAKERGVCYFRKAGVHYKMTHDPERGNVIEKTG